MTVSVAGSWTPKCVRKYAVSKSPADAEIHPIYPNPNTAFQGSTSLLKYLDFWNQINFHIRPMHPCIELQLDQNSLDSGARMRGLSWLPMYLDLLCQVVWC